MAMNFYTLKNLKRCFSLPFPLESAGVIEDHPYASVVVTGKLELCIRLSSTERVSREMVGGKLYLLHYPNAIVKTPELPHIFTVSHPRDAVFFKWPPEFEERMREAGFLKEPQCWDIVITQEMNRILRETRELLPHASEYGVADRLDLLAIRMLEEVILQRELSHGVGVFSDARIQRIAAYFQLHFCSEIDLEKLLRDNGISRRHFFRCWNCIFPMSPGTYIQYLKLSEGARLLSESNLSVWEITRKLGFQNSSYFCLIFKRHFGASPLHYRSAANGEKFHG